MRLSPKKAMAERAPLPADAEAVIEADATRKALMARGRQDLLTEDYGVDEEGNPSRRQALASQISRVRKVDQVLGKINENLNRAADESGRVSDTYLEQARSKTDVLRSAVQGISAALRELRD